MATHIEVNFTQGFDIKCSHNQTTIIDRNKEDVYL